MVLKYRDVIVKESGKICSKADEIWEVMSKELLSKNLSIPKSSLYSYVSCDTAGIRKVLMPDFAKRERIECPNDTSTVQSDSNNDLSINSSSNSIENSSKTVEVFLSKREFDELLVRKQYNNK